MSEGDESYADQSLIEPKARVRNRECGSGGLTDGCSVISNPPSSKTWTNRSHPGEPCSTLMTALRRMERRITYVVRIKDLITIKFQKTKISILSCKYVTPKPELPFTLALTPCKPVSERLKMHDTRSPMTNFPTNVSLLPLPTCHLCSLHCTKFLRPSRRRYHFPHSPHFVRRISRDANVVITLKDELDVT